MLSSPSLQYTIRLQASATSLSPTPSQLPFLGHSVPFGNPLSQLLPNEEHITSPLVHLVLQMLPNIKHILKSQLSPQAVNTAHTSLPLHLLTQECSSCSALHRLTSSRKPMVNTSPLLSRNPSRQQTAKPIAQALASKCSYLDFSLRPCILEP